MPSRGGTPRVYRLPSLAEIPSLVRGRIPPVEAVVGLDPESELLFVRTDKQDVLALDLESGRLDTVATRVERATLGPDGTLYTVDAKGQVITLGRRVRFAWPQPLGGVPRDLFGAVGQRLVAVVPEHPSRVITAADDQPTASREIALGGGG
ncbi:MAG: hypothetical protein ACRDH5_01680, partial [bacterium]